MSKQIHAEVKDLGEFSVNRVLPNASLRSVGPFIFFDHAGPVDFAAGDGINVRPHPHIGLATLTYLLEGSVLHRDSLGNCQEITPGDVNWMIAGRGITHSERESIEVKSRPHRLEALQFWVALPAESAEIAPDFQHVSGRDLPHFMYQGITAKLIAGEAFGMSAPLKTFSPMFLLDVYSVDQQTLEHPNPEHECLVYVARGEACLGDTSYAQGATVLLESGDSIELGEATRVVLLGGAALPRPPHLVWNFVSFDKDRLKKAEQDWRDGKFPAVPGDEQERIPFPD